MLYQLQYARCPCCSGTPPLCDLEAAPRLRLCEAHRDCVITREPALSCLPCSMVNSPILEINQWPPWPREPIQVPSPCCSFHPVDLLMFVHMRKILRCFVTDAKHAAAFLFLCFFIRMTHPGRLMTNDSSGRRRRRRKARRWTRRMGRRVRMKVGPRLRSRLALALALAILQCVKPQLTIDLLLDEVLEGPRTACASCPGPGQLQVRDWQGEPTIHRSVSFHWMQGNISRVVAF